MKLLAEISDASLGLSTFEILNKSFVLRKSARVVLRNETGLIAVQYLGRDLLHKLPGGGVEIGETVEQAAHREVREEVGCDIEIVSSLGCVIEYREQHTLLHLSECFVAHVQGIIGEPQLEQAEIDEEMTTVWMTPEEALQTMLQDKPRTYQGLFITKREQAFLSEYLKCY